jgi:hypothetical protein
MGRADEMIGQARARARSTTCASIGSWPLGVRCDVVVATLLVIGLSSAGCAGSEACLPVHSPSFRVALCATPSEEPIIVGDGACADAQFECTSESPCTAWAVFSHVSAGVCTVRLDVGGESDTLSLQLFDMSCARVQPLDRDPSEPYRMGPGCELDDGT